MNDMANMHGQRNVAPRRALVLIPGTMNYYSNQNGRRVAEALDTLGFAAEATTLDACPAGEFDVCVLSNISEILQAGGDAERTLSRVLKVVARSRATLSLSIECVSTPRYQRLRSDSDRAGVNVVLDLGLLDQTGSLQPWERSGYRFVFSGLTPSEERVLKSLDEDGSEREVPWALIGFMTPHRTALADHLVQQVDPRGFLYLPRQAPYLESGSPHLNQQQLERVLGRTRYQVWCSPHSHFYMEPERFRASLLTGGVPIKVVESRDEVPESAPLGYLMMEKADLGRRLTKEEFPRLRHRLRDDWRCLPTLSDGMAESLRALGFHWIETPSQAA